MAKYHISPKTNGPARCIAQPGNCDYEHYSTKAEAVSAVEEAALRSAGGALPEAQSRAERQPSVPLGEIEVKKELDRYGHHYQELWLKDETGASMVYAKVNLKTWGTLPDGTLGAKPGVVICDVEINPVARGRGYPLELMRKLKETYGAEQVEFTGTFSEDGYRMFQKLQAHEAATGEKLVAIQMGEKLREPKAGESYSFVEDWEKEWGKYPL